MIALAFAILGALLAWRRAAKLGGSRADKLQFATVGALIGFLLGLVLSIAADWAGVV